MPMTTADVAEKVAATLEWAAKQADFPLFKDIAGLDIGEVNLTINNPGPVQRFRLVVEDISCDEHEWETLPNTGGLIDRCTVCGEERA
jgi:hypothetical protein